MVEVVRAFGRQAFGGDPAAYDRARPAYPEWVWEMLRDQCDLKSGTRTFEVGAGAGLATQHLLTAGADPLVAIEPDARSAAYLRASLDYPALDVRVMAFEDVDLEPRAFDLGFAGTAFHWIEPDAGLAKVGLALQPGGWWTVVWNVFGDPERDDPFHEATDLLLNGVSSPSDGQDGALPYALDILARRRELERCGLFDLIEHRLEPWTLTLDASGVRALYATYSNLTVRGPDEQEKLLDGLAEIAERQFGGIVQRNIVTAMYVAERRL